MILIIVPAPRGPPERSMKGAERKVPSFTAGVGAGGAERCFVTGASTRAFGNTFGPSRMPIGGSSTGVPLAVGLVAALGSGAAVGVGVGAAAGSPACFTGG